MMAVNGASPVQALSHFRYHLCAAFAVLAWGMSFIFSKTLLEHHLWPIEIYVLRFVVAYVIVVCISHTQLWSRTWKDELLFLVCGMLSGSLYFVAENVALQYTLMANVSLLTSLSPLLTVLLAGLIIKGAKIQGTVVTGSLVALFGVGMVIFNSSFEMKVNPLGDLLSIAAAIFWAVYSLLIKKLSGPYNVWFITRKTFFYGVVTGIIMMVCAGENVHWAELATVPVLSNLLLLALVCSFAAFVAFALAVKGMGAVKAGNYMYFQPVVTLIAGFLLKGEAVTLVGVTGCALIILGVWLADWLTARQARRLADNI